MLNHLHTLNSSTIVSLTATNTLQLTATLQITPLFDVQHEDVAHAYREGLQSRLQTDQDLLAVSFLVNSLHSAIERNWFDQRHEAQFRQFVGFIFGEIHGKVLTPNGKRRSDATTLVTLKSRDDQRGYRAGRLWFFYEATPDERTLTDNELLKRLREYVTDSVMWGDPEEVWSYTVACLLGELSGHLFPLTAQEQQAREAEYRYWHEKLDRQ
jgi:hypothetical protein